MNPSQLTFFINVLHKQRNCLFRVMTILAIVLIAGMSSRAHAACGLHSLHSMMMSETLQVGPSTSLPDDAQHVGSNPGRRSAFSAREPIVGLWQITAKDSSGNIVDRVISGWTADGLEFDQDISPILTGYVCYGS
jgi:hypothetical protein